jgi:chromosome segregation ATPase
MSKKYHKLISDTREELSKLEKDRSKLTSENIKSNKKKEQEKKLFEEFSKHKEIGQQISKKKDRIKQISIIQAKMKNDNAELTKESKRLKLEIKDLSSERKKYLSSANEHLKISKDLKSRIVSIESLDNKIRNTKDKIKKLIDEDKADLPKRKEKKMLNEVAKIANKKIKPKTLIESITAVPDLELITPENIAKKKIIKTVLPPRKKIVKKPLPPKKPREEVVLSPEKNKKIRASLLKKIDYLGEDSEPLKKKAPISGSKVNKRRPMSKRIPRQKPIKKREVIVI